MKKEKRELTLEQLERKKEFFADSLPKILVILLFLIFIIFAIISEKKWISTEKTISIYIVTVFFWFVILLLSYKVLYKIRKQITLITLKEKQMKLKHLKQLAKENGGNIKAFVSLKDEKAITDILSKGIEKVVIDFTQDLKVGITTIYFSNDGFQSDVITSKESLISSLNEECKKKILNNCVESIELTEFGGNKKQIVISGPGFCYVDEKESEDELMEMFELKE